MFQQREQFVPISRNAQTGAVAQTDRGVFPGGGQSHAVNLHAFFFSVVTVALRVPLQVVHGQAMHQQEDPSRGLGRQQGKPPKVEGARMFKCAFGHWFGHTRACAVGKIATHRSLWGAIDGRDGVGCRAFLPCLRHSTTHKPDRFFVQCHRLPPRLLSLAGAGMQGSAKALGGEAVASQAPRVCL